MSETDTDAELGLDPEQMEALDPHIRDELRRGRQLKRDLAAKDAELAVTRRESAFAKAGIPDTPLNQKLASTYEGENDPGAIKAYFEGLGVDLTSTSAGTATQGSPATGEQTTEAELAEERRLAQVGAAGGDTGDVSYEDALRSAKTEAELLDLIANAPPGAKIAPVEIS